MKTLYKDGKEALCNKDQVDLMLKAGWSLDKPEAEEDEGGSKKSDNPLLSDED